jgi:hydroxymethylpyrimidine/phosphomethylpyrimidine kinase
MPSAASAPIALTVAGSDSGGGAGIQADLNTFAALGVHGLTAITCVTAQNPVRVLGIEPCSDSMVRRQLEAIFEEFQPRAAKTGMLFTSSIIQIVSRCFAARRTKFLVVDPVMVATSGACLLNAEAIRAMQTRLFPLATLITPNLSEAEVLLGACLKTPEDLRSAARALHKKFGCAALVKGGHLRSLKEAIDIFYDGKTELLLRSQFIRGLHTHGTGCSYSAAITAHLAMGRSLPEAVIEAKGFIAQAIAQSRRIGRHTVLRWNLT